MGCLADLILYIFAMVLTFRLGGLQDRIQDWDRKQESDSACNKYPCTCNGYIGLSLGGFAIVVTSCHVQFLWLWWLFRLSY